MIVSGYSTFYQINKSFANILFFIIEKMSLRDKIASWVGWNGFASQIWPAGLSLETPGLQYNWSQVEAKQLPTLHCTVIGLMRERLVALGIPSWTHLRTRYWGVFTLQETQRIAACAWPMVLRNRGNRWKWKGGSCFHCTKVLFPSFRNTIG